MGLPKSEWRTGCSVEGCDGPHLAKGFCCLHYHRWKKSGSTEPSGVMFGKRPAKPCSVEGCDRHVSSHGLCSVHWKRFARRGVTVPFVPSRAPYVDGAGYIRERVEGQKQGILQHRIVMERILGRPLRAGESVHHRNGIKTDNGPENLELWFSGHPSGQRVEDLLAFAREIIARYGEAFSDH
jgi:hypothetical protein